MKKVKRIHEKYQKELFLSVQNQLDTFQKIAYYDELAIDNNEKMHVIELIHQHLYFFYLRHLREEKILISEVYNEKAKKIEIKYEASAK